MLRRWNDYEQINENLQKALRILRDNKVSEDNKNFLKLRQILRRNTGYLGKFTEWLIVQKKSIESLEDLYKKIKEAKIKKPIDDFNKPEDVIDYIIREDSSTAVNQMINSIPSKTRNSLKSDNCDDCGGDGELGCQECDGDGEIECDCRDEDCEECGGDGKIKCEKCDGDGEIECKECKGEGEIKCEECDGEGGLDCKKCDGKGCDDCDGQGDIDCKKCDGHGYKKCLKCQHGYFICKECDGKGEKSCSSCGDKKCKRCGGEGFYKCKECKGNGKIKCKKCKDGTPEWRSFLEFLKLHTNKKDLICDFLSKKGGRYGDEGDYNYDEGPLYTLRKDIEKLINMPSIETIKKNLPKEENVKFIYDDDEILVIASNYDGLQKYGSSYWCITQDSYTFKEYVYEYGINQQWIIFMKNKSPYVDDKSVMGVTIDILKGSVSASHWEDDSTAPKTFVEKIFHKIDLDNIIKAEPIFSRSNELAIFILPEKNKDEIKDLIDEANWSNDNKKTVSLETILSLGDEYDLFSSVNRITTKFFDVVKSILKENDMMFKDDDYFDTMIYDFDLKDYIIFNKGWNSSDINYIINSKEKEKALSYVGWFIANGYDITRYFKGAVPELLKKLDVEKIIVNNITSIDNWSSMIQSLTPRQVNSVYKKILKGDKKPIIVNSLKGDSFIKSVVKWIVEEDNVSEYKKDILDLINYPDRNYQLNKSVIDYILDNIEDDDIETACVYRMIHPRISKKYNFEMKRKPTLENLISWDKF